MAARVVEACQNLRATGHTLRATRLGPTPCWRSRLQGTSRRRSSRKMSALAVRTKSVNLGQGFPDVDGPPSVITRAVEALARGCTTSTHPGIGVPAKPGRRSCDHQKRHYGIDLDPDHQVVVTTGCTEGVAAALLGLVDDGDEVVVLEPYYDSYVAMIQMAGGVRRPVTLRAPDYRLDLDQLRPAVTAPHPVRVARTSPHNPTGTVLNRDELEAIAALAIERDLVVITDEVYETWCSGSTSTSRSATLPGMFERTLTLSSAGKSYSFTGWKVGWATGPADGSAPGAVLAAKQWLTFTSGAPLQPGRSRTFSTTSPTSRCSWPADLQEAARPALRRGRRRRPRRHGCPRAPTSRSPTCPTSGWEDGLEFCEALPERAGVVAIPAQAFYDDVDAGRHLVRWAFCKEPDVIEDGLRRLRGAALEK